VELGLRDAPKERPSALPSPSGFSFAADRATICNGGTTWRPQLRRTTYKILDLVGSSEKSIEDAIQNAATRASTTIREMKWFEVVQTRSHIEDGSVRHYQVVLRVGFTLEG
jgi:flavin-binding protein dodecin